MRSWSVACLPIGARNFAASLSTTNMSSTSRSRTSITRALRQGARKLITLRTRRAYPGVCERFHKTLLDEFYRIAFRKKLYRSIAELQKDLDAWLIEYNNERPHQGRWCYGKTPMQTFVDTLPVAKEKLMQAA
jgi:transposase InsO family protein